MAQALDTDVTSQEINYEVTRTQSNTLRQTSEVADAGDTAEESVKDGYSTVVTAPSSPSSSPATTSSRRAKKKPQQPKPQPASTLAMPPSIGPVALLICSVGNPGSTYANTLHSAGHTLVQSLSRHLGSSQFAKDRALGNGLVSQVSSPPWTLWQSPSYMNESGKPVATAWRAFSRQLPPGYEGRLVIVHDELEKPLGAISIRDAAGLSARGHNGLKSILQHVGKESFVRIGVGIGRPISRDRDDVSRYVLKKMSSVEKDKIEGAADGLIGQLRNLSGD